MNSRVKSLCKALTWRVVSVVVDAVVVLLFTGDFGLVWRISLVLTVIKVVLFYVQDRLWKKVKSK